MRSACFPFFPCVALAVMVAAVFSFRLRAAGPASRKVAGAVRKESSCWCGFTFRNRLRGGCICGQSTACSWPGAFLCLC